MSNLTDLLWKYEKRAMAEEGFQREVATGVFAEQRDRLMAALGAMMRLHSQIQQRNTLFAVARQFEYPEGMESRQWCNAALHLLTHADENVQRFFLASDHSIKRKLVQAVIDDGGIENLAGFWAELPE